MEGVWKQLNARLEEECLKDFEKICAERNVVDSLNELERVIEGAKIRKQQADDGGNTAQAVQKPIHTLSANELYNAHIATAMVQAERGLKDKLDTVHNSNRDKASQVKRQRQEMEELLIRMEKLIEDVEDAARVLEQDTMRNEIKQELAVPIKADAKMTG